VVVRPMVMRRTRPIRSSELGELTGPHRTPRVVRPMRSTGASGMNLTERVLTVASEI
jgi:pilus assembly protein TadC